MSDYEMEDVPVSELKFAQLDYAVAIAVGYTLKPLVLPNEIVLTHTDKSRYASVINFDIARMGCSYWSPSANWHEAGELLVKEAIAVCPVLGGTWVAAMNISDDGDEVEARGTNPLEAICRVYIKSRFGNDKISVPLELKRD